MTLKNRGLLKYGLPVLYRNGVKLIKEGHDHLTVGAFHPDQLPNFENGKDPHPIHRFRWSMREGRWLTFDASRDKWVDYDVVVDASVDD